MTAIDAWKQRAEAAEQQLAASEAALREAREDAARYLWLRKSAYVLSSQHHDGRCAYEVQKEPVGLWIKTSIRSDDASVDAAVDAARAAAKEARDGSG